MSTTLDSSKFSKWLKSVIDAKKLSYREIESASANEISRSYISLLIKGKSLPGDLSLKKIVALANGLDISPRELIENALEDELKRLEYGKELSLESKKKIPYLEKSENKKKKKAG